MIGLGGQGTTVVDGDGTSLGNLSDGIFLLDPGATVSISGGNQTIPSSDVIEGNTISNNQGAGIHAVDNTGVSMSAGGADDHGQPDRDRPVGHLRGGAVPDELVAVRQSRQRIRRRIPGRHPDHRATSIPLVTIEGNVISGNHANGVDLLDSQQVLIAGNQIGTNTNVRAPPAIPGNDFGNAANGVFVNQSEQITIGGTTSAARNIISGNHSSGVFVSGTATEPGSTVTGMTSER